MIGTCLGCGTMQFTNAPCPVCKKERESLKRLLKRCQAPLRFASIHYLDNGMLGQEHKTDCLIDSIKAALKGRP